MMDHVSIPAIVVYENSTPSVTDQISGLENLNTVKIHILVIFLFSGW